MSLKQNQGKVVIRNAGSRARPISKSERPGANLRGTQVLLLCRGLYSCSLTPLTGPRMAKGASFDSPWPWGHRSADDDPSHAPSLLVVRCLGWPLAPPGRLVCYSLHGFSTAAIIKYHRPGGLVIGIYFPIILESGGPRSRCWQAWFP